MIRVQVLLLSELLRILRRRDFLSEFDPIVLVIIRLFDWLLTHLLRNKILSLVPLLYHARPDVLVVIWMLR